MKKHIKGIIVGIISLVFGSVFLVNKTQAWLLAQTDQRDNLFTVGKVTHEIEEEFNKQLKTNVSIVNSGTTSTLMRVKLAPQWLDETGSQTVALSAANTYTIEFNTVDWFEKDGFWYCRQSVASGEKSPVLVKSAQPKADLPKGYAGKVFNLQVISQSVQATPTEAVIDLWGFNPNTY